MDITVLRVGLASGRRPSRQRAEVAVSEVFRRNPAATFTPIHPRPGEAIQHVARRDPSIGGRISETDCGAG